MKDKPAYSFEFQKETIENLFKSIAEQGPPKKTPKPGPVTDKSLKFTRRGSAGAQNRIRIKDKKPKNCCTGVKFFKLKSVMLFVNSFCRFGRS